MHLRRLRQQGPIYAVNTVRRVSRKIADRVEARRIDRAKRLGRSAPESLWMTSFVAANHEAADRYEARPYSGTITVFHATADSFDAGSCRELGLGWSHLAAGGLDFIEVPGGHLTMLQEPAVEALAGELAGAMERCRLKG